MRTRKRFIAANWKMNPAPAGFDAKDSPYRTHADCDVVVFPMTSDLQKVRTAELLFGSQGARPERSGAFTGDESMAAMKDAGCRYVLCGHSERRRVHAETNEFVMEQVIAALELGLHPVLCIGETVEERKAGKTHDVLKKQLHGLPESEQIVIAYEPVWSIGSGTAATPDEAADAHAFIRNQSKNANVRILYGGSVDDNNAASFLAKEDIDGLLVGGASLKPAVFGAIVAAARA